MLRIGEFASLAQVSPRTLRHYASLGLVMPASVDPATGYRYYELGQLVDLQRVVALRDLGFGLDVIRELRDANGGMSVERLRGMLDLRRAELSATITQQSARLERVAALLDDMEKGIGMQSIDVTLRTADRQRIAVTEGVAPGHGYANLGPVFDERLPIVWDYLTGHNLQPGIACASFEWPDEDGRIVAHLGFNVGDQTVTASDDVEVVEFEPAEVASVFHRGPMSGFTEAFLAAVRWIDTNGYEIAERSRELYHKWTPDDPEAIVVELQIPLRLRES